MRRLLVLSTEFPPGPGGIGTHAYQLTIQLSQLGWDVSVLCAQDFVPEADIAAFNAKQLFAIERFVEINGSLGIWLSRWRTTYRWLSNWQPDVVLATGYRSVWLAAALATLGLMPRWAAVGHGSEFASPSGWRMALTRYAFERASAVICVSTFTQRQMTAARIAPRQTEIIHNGGDHTLFAPAQADEHSALCHSLGLAEGSRFLLTVGSVTERKGQDTVIRAMPLILSSCPSAHYLIVGLPTRQSDFSGLAAQLGVGDNVHFLGYLPRSQIATILSTAEVFVMTSRQTPTGDFEGYGIAVVEAALCGTPAVVSDNAGLVESMIPGETGLAVPSENPEATASAILSLLNNDTRRYQMGAAARQRALAEQTWEQRALTYHRLLSDLAAN